MDVDIQPEMASSNPGNFANNREKAAEAGRKGGKNSDDNFANDRESRRSGPQRWPALPAAQAGRKADLTQKGPLLRAFWLVRLA